MIIHLCYGGYRAGKLLLKSHVIEYAGSLLTWHMRLQGPSPHFSPGLLRASCPAPLRSQRRCAPLFKIVPGDFVGGVGHSGKADWPIARRGIAVTMGEAEFGKGPVDLYPAERVVQGRTTPDHPA